MSTYRPPSSRSLLEAGYGGLPKADPTVAMTTAIAAVRAALYDLRQSPDPKFRLGANEMEIAWAMVARRRPVLLQADFQCAYDHLEGTGQATAIVCDRGTCYSLTTSGRLQEEASRVAWWRKQVRAMPAVGRYAAAVLAGSFLTLLANSIYHSFFK